VSQENVQIVRDLVAALNSADVDGMVSRYYASDAEFVPAMQARSRAPSIADRTRSAPTPARSTRCGTASGFGTWLI
jgi:ketosteroid isomerase-like protein